MEASGSTPLRSGAIFATTAGWSSFGLALEELVSAPLFGLFECPRSACFERIEFSRIATVETGACVISVWAGDDLAYRGRFRPCAPPIKGLSWLGVADCEASGRPCSFT